MPTRRALPLACIGAILLCAFAAAQAQAPGPAPIPEAMPFDIPYGAPIDLDNAQKAIMAAVAEAKKHNWKEAIAVVGPAGQLVAHATMDNTQYARSRLLRRRLAPPPCYDVKPNCWPTRSTATRLPRSVCSRR